MTDHEEAEILPGGLLVSQAYNPGYHTRIEAGSRVRATRENVWFALELLDGGTEEGRARAEVILAALVPLQERRAEREDYGTWPWYWEEPLERMTPPDLNWADFVGTNLLEILWRHGERIEPGLRAEVGVAVGHAARCVWRRDIGPHYTNIAIMGAVLTLGAGEWLGERELADYGLARLRRFHAHTLHHGGLNEYNSPTYTVVTLREIERLIELVREPEAVALGRDLHRRVWRWIADFFHPGTGQWAGPHSRVYADRLREDAEEFLAARTGLVIGGCDGARPSVEWRRGRPPLACPADVRDMFQRLAEPGRVHRQVFVRRAVEGDVVGTVWMDETRCFGSVSFDTLWVQRRPLLGYWRTPERAVAMVRARLLKDGRDWASAAIYCAQEGPLVLAAVDTVRDGGDHHLMLDRPEGGVFGAENLAVEIGLHAAGATVARVEETLWRLEAGGSVAWVRTTGRAVLAGSSAGWAERVIAGGVAVAARAEFSPPAKLDPEARSLEAVFAVKVGGVGDGPPPEITEDGVGGWRCGSCAVARPARAASFRYGV